MKTKLQTSQASLNRRIKQFYNLLNHRDFERCHEMIDPRVRLKSSSVTLLQYMTAGGEFLDHFGRCEIVELHIDLHLRERSALYDDRDFAIGKTVWKDERGQGHAFSERWVRDGRAWYTRSTGFVAPAPLAKRGGDALRTA